MQTNERNVFFQLADGSPLAVLLLGCFVWTLSPALSDAHAGEDKPGQWVVLFDGEVLDLITRETYENFELDLEWRVAPGGNAGVFFMVTEWHPEVWHTGPEVQILDDAGHPDGENPKTSAGSIYALVAPADGKKLHPAGRWNRARFRLEDGRLRHWLNGVEILDVDFFSDEFRAIVAESNFARMPDFAKARRGHIALQHASVSPLKAGVWYRKVRLRELP